MTHNPSNNSNFHSEIKNEDSLSTDNRKSVTKKNSHEKLESWHRFAEKFYENQEEFKNSKNHEQIVNGLNDMKQHASDNVEKLRKEHAELSQKEDPSYHEISKTHCVMQEKLSEINIAKSRQATVEVAIANLNKPSAFDKFQEACRAMGYYPHDGKLP